MSSRDIILASIRANLPKLDRPLPAVPKFEDNPPADLIEAFGKISDANGRATSWSGSHGRHAGFDPGSARTQPSRLFVDAGDQRANSILRRSSIRGSWLMSITPWCAPTAASPKPDRCC